MLRCVAVVLPGLILLGYGDAIHPMLDVLSHFQFQYFVIGIVCTSILCLLGSWRMSSVAAIGTVLTGLALAPWYVPSSLPDDLGSRTIVRVMQFNILEPNTRYDDVATEVRHHDVALVVFQEADERWVDGLEQLDDALPHSYFQPAGMLRGNLIRSRYPLSDVVLEPSIGGAAAPSVSMTIDVNGQRVSLLVGHTTPPHDAYFSDLRNRELQRLAQRAAEMPTPVIFLGDLNTAMWSPHYKAFERESGLSNARRGFGVVNSFPMDGYAMLRVPLDHCMVSSDIAVLDFRRGAACGSDHAPIIAELALPLSH